MESSQQREPFATWAIVELMGHRRLGAYLTEQEIAGAGFLRLDVPGADGEMVATQFVQPSSVYCLTPVTEELARAVAKRNQPEPVQRWELPQETRTAPAIVEQDDYDEDAPVF